MQDFTRKTTISDTKRTLRSHHYIEIEKTRKHLSGILHIENTKADIEKKVDELINDKIDFNNTHIIKYNILPVSNIPEEERFTSSMTTIVFRNDQDESICYVNSTFQVLFFNIYFRTLIMNIYCDRMLTNIDNSIDDYNGHIKKVIIIYTVVNICQHSVTIDIHD